MLGKLWHFSYSKVFDLPLEWTDWIDAKLTYTSAHYTFSHKETGLQEASTRPVKIKKL